MNRFLRLAWLSSLPVLTGFGCAYPFNDCCGRAPKAVEIFSDLEREASQYGFISAGAIRVTPYDHAGLKTLRDKLIKQIDELIADFKGNPKPEMSAASLQITELLANLSLIYKGAPSLGGVTPPEMNTDAFKALQTAISNAFSGALNTELEANRIDMIRLRLGYLKFLDAEYANLNLMETLPVAKDFRRFMVTVQLTALVRAEEAQGAMVLFDFYPLHADTWAHHAGGQLKNIWKEEAAKGEQGKPYEKVADAYAKVWKENLPKIQGTFVPNSLPPQPSLDKEIFDFEGWMHHYLITNGLMPRIVHVEPLDTGELFNRLDLTASSVRLATALGADMPKTDGLLQAGYGSTEAQGQRAQLVNPLSLAFAAGNNRAGWLFLPSMAHAHSPILKPTERRIRMVVDLPVNLRRVALHVHKMFTDESLRPIKAAPFDKQLAKLNHARHLLSASEEDFPKNLHEVFEETKGYSERKPWERTGATDFKSSTIWELMKSRMRNILYQGWSEALSFEVAEEPKPEQVPDQTALLEDDGENLATAFVRTVKGKTPTKVEAWLEIPRAKVVFLNPFFPIFAQFEPYAFRAEEITSENLKGHLKLVFPSIKKFDAGELTQVPKIRLKLVYEGSRAPDNFPVAYAVKKKEKTPGFTLSVPAGQIQADHKGFGKVIVLLKKDKNSPIKSMTLEVKGADVLLKKDQKMVFDADASVPLDLGNLSERSPVTFSAKNDEGTPAPAVTLLVERLPEPPEDP